MFYMFELQENVSQALSHRSILLLKLEQRALYETILVWKKQGMESRSTMIMLFVVHAIDQC